MMVICPVRQQIMENKKRKKLSRESILAEAKKLFSTKGYRGTTLDDITKKFGVSRPSLYYYFKSKNDILAALHAQGFMATDAQINSVLDSDSPTDIKFRKILELHVRTIANDTELQKIFFTETNEMPEKIIESIRNRRSEYTQLFIGLYEKGVAEGFFKEIEPKIAIYLLLGACNWISFWYSPKKRIDSETAVQTLLTILCEGYEKKAEGV